MGHQKNGSPMFKLIDPVVSVAGLPADPLAMAPLAVLQPAGPARLPATVAANHPDVLHEALLESRQRWRELVNLCADLAFETDVQGRFVFLSPDAALGWPTAMLLGQPAGLLLADTAGTPGFDPFAPIVRTRGRRAWLKRPDGSHVCLIFSSAPLLDDLGQIIGARGVGQDITEQDTDEAQVAAVMRRSQVVDHILACMHKEVQAPRMMKAALAGLTTAMAAEGCAVLDMLGDGVQAAVMHQVGVPPTAVLHAALTLLEADPDRPSYALASDGRWTLGCPSQTTATAQSALALWRGLGGRPWDADDMMLAAAANSIIRVILQHDTMQRDMSQQARTDPLTGLLNRRAFKDEVSRRSERLTREGLPGTLLFIDLDCFKQLNDRYGHDVGDEALCVAAQLLRDTVRPADLVARLGGDEFAVWMDGADDLTAAERAEHLTVQAPRALRQFGGGHDIPLGMSIGIATRWPGKRESLEETLQRADQAMYQAKRAGRGQWRAWRQEAA